MKVKDLIEALSKVDGEVEVLMVAPCEPGYRPVARIEEAAAYPMSYQSTLRLAAKNTERTDTTPAVVFYTEE